MQKHQEQLLNISGSPLFNRQVLHFQKFIITIGNSLVILKVLSSLKDGLCFSFILMISVTWQRNERIW